MRPSRIKLTWPELIALVLKEIEKCHFEIINRFAQNEKNKDNFDVKCQQKYDALRRRNTDPECSLDEKEIAQVTRVQILLQELIERTRHQHLYAAYEIEDEVTRSLQNDSIQRHYEEIRTLLYTKLPF